MSESDGIGRIGVEDEDTSVCGGEKESRMLPDQFMTVRGKTLKRIGAQQPGSPVLVSYSTSKLQGNALLNAAIKDPAALLSDVDLLYEDGFLEDDQGDENGSLILPIDAIDLSPDLRGIVIDCDLRGYAGGFPRMMNSHRKVPPNGLCYANMLGAVMSFVKALKHLDSKGYCWQEIDGHQFFFNAEYGSFRLIYDGIGLFKQKGTDLPGYAERLSAGIAEIVLFLFTGAWPDGEGSGMVQRPASNARAASWDCAADTLSGDAETVNAWNAMPTVIKKAITDSCFANTGNIFTPDDWVTILRDAMADVDECAFCGGDIFKTAAHCLHCGKTTSKDSLLTKWSIQRENQAGEIRVSFGRGVLLPGEFLGLSARFAPCMKIMYNPKSNALGIKNMSGMKWIVTKSGIALDLLPGSIMPIDKEMSIEFEGHPEIMMRFMGYEC